VPGAKKLLPQPWRKDPFFDNIYKLVGVPVITVQLRYNGWVTELNDAEKRKTLGKRSNVPGEGGEGLFILCVHISARKNNLISLLSSYS
jgi:uncharacterized protein with NAD-binding domain and iron-sulfur cluster